MYSEYEIRASLIAALEQALSETQVPGKWEVMARNQPVMTYGNRVVLVDKISTQRNGFQGRGYHTEYEESEKEGKRFKKKTEFEQWIEEITWQISVLRKRLPDDDVGTLTADDVAKKLIWWLNSRHGAAEMRGRKDVPFAPVFTSSARTQEYDDDSDNHQAMEQFDFRMMLVQTAGLDTKIIEGFDVKTYPI